MLTLQSYSVSFLCVTGYHSVKEAFQKGTGCKHRRMFRVPMIDWCVDKALLTSGWLRGKRHLMVRRVRSAPQSELLKLEAEDIEAQAFEKV